MKVRFWGARGSLPATVSAGQIRAKVLRALREAQRDGLDKDTDLETWMDQHLPFWVRSTYGGNTTCLEVENPGGETILLDAGSGLRDFGARLMKDGRGLVPGTYHFFMTHLHWDHLQGFPFFPPIYIRGNRIVIHSYHEGCEDAFRAQMRPPVFPVPFDSLGAEIVFDIQPPLTPYAVGGFRITSFEQLHPGVSYAYRLERGGRSFVLSTDSEHKSVAFSPEYPFIEFIRNADVLVFDAQYSMADATFSKADWGHSSNVMGVELAARAGVGTLVLCHHDPLRDDESLEEFLQNSRLYREIYLQETLDEPTEDACPRQVMLAHDGLELTW
ncbi:MAG: MBL fold metallo-hydrolase [Opitutales bacterium]